MKISARISGPVNKLLANLFADDGFTCEVTIRQRGITTWNQSLGKNTTTNTDHTVTAIRAKHSTKSVEMSKVPGVAVGDSLYLVRNSAVEGAGITFLPSPNDVVITGDQTLGIKGADDFMFAYSITVVGG